MVARSSQLGPTVTFFSFVFILLFYFILFYFILFYFIYFIFYFYNFHRVANTKLFVTFLPFHACSQCLSLSQPENSFSLKGLYSKLLLLWKLLCLLPAVSNLPAELLASSSVFLWKFISVYFITLKTSLYWVVYILSTRLYVLQSKYLFTFTSPLPHAKYLS